MIMSFKNYDNTYQIVLIVVQRLLEFQPLLHFVIQLSVHPTNRLILQYENKTKRSTPVIFYVVQPFFLEKNYQHYSQIMKNKKIRKNSVFFFLPLGKT